MFDPRKVPGYPAPDVELADLPKLPRRQHDDIFSRLGELPDCFSRHIPDQWSGHTYTRTVGVISVTFTCACGQEWDITPRPQSNRRYVAKGE